MRAKLYHFWQETVIFYLGGMFYCGVELLWRGWTHGSMFLLGGLCFYLVGGLNRRFRLPVLAQMLLGAVIVTFFEFWTGVLVNQTLHMHVWDYSAVPMNLMGQICLPFTLLWFPLSGIAVFCEDGSFTSRCRNTTGLFRKEKLCAADAHGQQQGEVDKYAVRRAAQEHIRRRDAAEYDRAE